MSTAADYAPVGVGVYAELSHELITPWPRNLVAFDVCPPGIALHNGAVKVIPAELPAMPQPVFDVLTYSRDLESAGLSRQQAEAIARGMTIMVSQQVESLVTREHFDLHMGQVDGRLDRVESRLSGLEKSQAAQTTLLTVVALAVVIPLVQSVVAG